MKVIIRQKFVDKVTKEVYQPGMEVEFTEERAEEIKKKLPKAIEVPKKVEKPVEKPKRARAKKAE